MSIWGVISVLGLLLVGSGSAMLRKVLFEMPGVGLHGICHTFKKPFFTSLDNRVVCCTGLLCQLIIITRRRQKQRNLQKGLREHLLQSVNKSVPPGYNPRQLQFSPMSWGLIGKLTWPAMFGTLMLIFNGMGLKYVSATMNQMIGGSCIVFTAIMSAIFLKKKLNWMHITGISMVLLGIVIVSFKVDIYNIIAGVPSNDADWMAGGIPTATSNWESALGICLILMAQVSQAAQMIVEEVLLGGKEALEPMEVIGWEGLLSVGWMAIVFLPLGQLLPGSDVDNTQENTIDSFVMLYRNPNINQWHATYATLLVGTNLFSVMVSAYLGSVFRAVLLTTMTGVVWIINLVTYKLQIGGGKYGESWEPSSWVQLAGFFVIIGGTVLYAQGSSKVARVLELLDEHGEEVDPDRLRTMLGLAKLSSTTPHYCDDLGLLDTYQLPTQPRGASFPVTIAPSPTHGAGRTGSYTNRHKSLSFQQSLLNSSSWVVDREDRRSKMKPQGDSSSSDVDEAGSL